MTKEQLIAKYNPANAPNLSQADIDAMRELTDDQLKELAQAYPNNANRKPYLILFDKNIKAEKQLYPLSTWQNLYNVRKFSNMKNLVAHTFKDLFTVARPGSNRVAANRTGSNVAKNTASARKVVDLSAAEAADELKASLPAKTAMVARTGPEPEQDKKGTNVEQPKIKSATTRTSSKAAAAKKTPSEAAEKTNKELPADQQLQDLGEGGQ